MKTNKIHNVTNSGLKAPKDYFDNLEDRLMAEIKLSETLSDSGFKAPDGYFDTLESSILSKVSEKETTKVIPLFNKKNLLYFSSIAAAVLLLFNLSIFEKETSWDSLDTETVENYILDENVGSYEIASLLLVDDISEDDFDSLEFADEAMEGYFLENTSVEDLIIK
ncbi:hypothetical protein [Algibacter lectus]|uniref:Uncharacterized protein n=1 Tax=Algibacter lectus TaxID=221126 RepID=A0A090VGY1_9FLAO|nr:hypothetical protein [Algibacter lectus]MWW25557.1 hypothetical protein [Algibacter lectus]TDY61503.1 hypothetical protein DFQ06_2841 [Algibacter lectus]GAL64000.1 hypothetical protein JCM19300_3203 [Algibacter lectus]